MSPITCTRVYAYLILTITLTSVAGIPHHVDAQSVQLADLPRLDWASGLNVDGTLVWGMSPDEASRIVGVALREFSTGWGDQFDASLSTTFRQQRIYLGLHQNGQQALHFLNGRLFTVLIMAQPGWEDGLIDALFSSFGPARYAERISGTAGERVEEPLPRTAPRSVPPVEDFRQHPELSSREYQWLDTDTEILASDRYCYNNISRRTERCVSVSFVSWRLGAGGPPDMRERYEETAGDFLTWLNWWRGR